jgi:hypothetical protein
MMDFQQLLSEIKRKPLQELRAHSENYFEAVLSATQLIAAEDVLVSYFGVPLKPAGLSPSGDADRFSKPYGGIRRNQTMYLRKGKDGNEVAFLWPWGDGVLVTLKVIAESVPQKAEPEVEKSKFMSFFKLFVSK